MKDVVSVIRARIDEKGMKDKAVAEKAGIEAHAFSQMMNRKQKIMATDYIELCKVLDLTPDDFVWKDGLPRMNETEKKLVWYFRNMSKEGKETLLKIARAFVATGTFSRNDEISEDLKEEYRKVDRYLDYIDARMDEEF